MKRTLLVLCAVLCTLFTQATIYYISTTGNDATGNGTSASPWRTLYKATSTVRTAGDIIHVNPGTYVETQTSNLAVGVSLEGEGVTSVIQSTLGGVNGWVLLLESASGSSTPGNQYVANLKFDGTICF